ncbi:MAG: copper resistance protein CopC/CopD [bacterium]|nr:copper resistance protein CopC/CopD [bacterium]
MLANALLRPSGADAHAFAVETYPQAGQRLTATPHVLWLQFSEAVVPDATRAWMTGAAGEAVHLGDATFGRHDTQLRVGLPLLDAGVYHVEWRAVSADDGHESAGVYAFAVGQTGTLPAYPRQSLAAISWPESLLSWLLFLCLALSTGGLVAVRLFASSAGRSADDQQPARWTYALLLVTIGTLIGQFALFAHSVGGAVRSHASLVGWLAAARVPAGILELGAILLVGIAILTPAIVRLPLLALGTLMVATILLALRTHPAATPFWWGKPVIAIHVVVALLWTGALLALLLTAARQREAALDPSWLRGVRRYSRLALWSALAVIVSGGLAAVLEIARPVELVSTEYGRILLLKLSLVAIALVAATLGRRGLAGIAPLTSSERGRRLSVPMRTEAAALVLVLGVAAVLAAAPPPPPAAPGGSAVEEADLEVQPPPISGSALHLAGRAGWYEVFLTAGADRLTIQADGPRTGSPERVHLMPLLAEHDTVSVWVPGAQARPTALSMQPCGTGCFSAPVHWPRGTTRVDVRITGMKWAGGGLAFDVLWPPPPNDPRTLRAMVDAMRHQRRIIVDERVSSGPGASAAHVFRLTGAQLMEDEPYGEYTPNVRAVSSGIEGSQLLVYLPASQIWAHLWVDRRQRLLRQVIVTRSNVVTDIIVYPE